jgi:hypothetical protein
MNAFMTPSGVIRLRDMLTDTSDQSMLANTWLLAPGASHAFRAGHLQVRPSGMDWSEFDQIAHEEAPSKAKVRIMPPLGPLWDQLPGTQSAEQELLVPDNEALSRTESTHCPGRRLPI